ncbi:MAG: phosphohistidine swiveling domain-containing protein [Verrucomicrobiales bacterium]|jgi:phosphohistidine swiveling domain-containing protein
MTVDNKRVRALDDPEALDINVSGAKGAGIARAKAAGFPVLDGFVIAPHCSQAALDRAVEVLEPRGTGGARMAIIGHQLDDDLVAEINTHAEALEPPLIVRSSSVLEGSGEWSGAFTSVPEIQPSEIGQATKSVWATCFSIEVLERFEEAELEPGSAAMGILVQPEIKPEFGGAAIVDAAGAVKIDAVKGSPADLMAGWIAGTRAVLEDGVLKGAEAIELLGESMVRTIGELALRVQSELGHNLIEWAVVDGEVILLQVQDSVVHEVEEAMIIPAALGHPFALDFVKLAHEYPGALGDELVLGWRAAAPNLAAVPFTPTGDRDATYAQARSMAATLLAQAWGEPEVDAVAHADLVLRRMRSDRPNESIDVLRDLNSIDEGLAAQLLGIADHLMATADGTKRRGLDRWEPVLAGVVALQGEVHEGEPSVGGVGSGRLVWINSSKDTSHVRPRDIIVTQYPLQNYSPLLWDAAGVITIGGAPTAHLFEVARSLTVPAVINCPIAEIVKEGPVLGMLDGDAGRVALLPRDPERPL